MGPSRARQQGAKLVDVARRAGVAAGTVSNVLNRPESVLEPTRLKVTTAMAELGYVRGGAPRELAAHPVPLLADPWPGVPVRGRNASGRAEACWLLIAPRLTPHSLRHVHKTLMEELGTTPKLMDERMGHEDGSVQARYSHITEEMRRRLMDGLTERWEASLGERRALNPGSPVAALDARLRTSS
jgi:hypothetical protein